MIHENIIYMIPIVLYYEFGIGETIATISCNIVENRTRVPTLRQTTLLLR